MNKRSQVLACVYVALLLQLARSVTIGGGKIGRILDINKQARTHLTPTLQCSDSGNPRELRSKDGALSSYRRKFLVSAMVWTLPIPLLLPPREALAALPITQGESENLGAKTFRFLRPKPPKVLRQRVSKDFAVLLMRSSYKTLDELDCVAMDQFQRDFFILRQGTYRPIGRTRNSMILQVKSRMVVCPLCSPHCVTSSSRVPAVRECSWSGYGNPRRLIRPVLL